MEENIKKLLEVLNIGKENIYDKEDNKKIEYLCESLRKLKTKIPKLDELKRIEKIEKDLEIKYEQFYEIGYYFYPIYVSIKRAIHNNEVNTLREENRRKNNKYSNILNANFFLEGSKMEKEIIKMFDDIINYLNLALENVNNNSIKINEEIERWKSDITFSELKDSLNLILKYILKWYTEYKETNDFLCIDLKEYDIVSKESSYLLGETALIDNIHSEEIDFLVGKIGATLKDIIIERRSSNE